MQICYHRVLASWTRQFFGYMAAVLLVAATSLSLLPASETRALTTTPTKMNFQGRLTDSAGTTMPDGLYNMKFRLFTVASGGTDVWNETRETTNRVQVTNGLFSVQLGAVTPISASLFASGSLYFEVELPTPATATCGTASCQTWAEGPMTTRSLLSTSAYAFNSETLDGLDSTGFIQNQNGSAQTSTNFWIDGTARSATVQAANGLILPGSNNTATFTVQNASTAPVLNVDTTNGEVELGSAALAGKLVLSDGSSNTLAISVGALAGDYTLTVPTITANDTLCLESLNNCGGDSVLVAASDSSQADKDAADYVADGNTAAAGDGDQIEINQALTAASGKKVVLFAGTYTVDASISIPNNTTLSGIGSNTVITIPNSFNAAINVITNTTTGGNGTGIVVQDLRLEGNRSNQTSGTMYGIYFNGVGSGTGASAIIGSTIKNVSANSFRAIGIALLGSSNNLLSGNTAKDNYDVGIALMASSNNNTLDQNLTQGNVGYGLSLSQSSYNTLTGNIARDDGDFGIALDQSSYNSISGNVANTSGAYGAGINLYNSSYNSVSGNTAESNDSHGIGVGSSSANNVISGNKIHDNGGATTNNGIILWSAVDNNTITGNAITDTSASTNNYAINITAGTSDKNYLADNFFSSTPGTATIYDTGTGTTYANQPTAENGMNLLNRTLNSITAFSIQGTNKVNILNVDTTNGELELGNYNGGTNAVNGKLVMGNSTNANLVTLQSGATSTSYTLTLPTAVGASGDCLKTSDASGTLTFGACGAGGGVTTVGALDGGTANANGATISGTTIYLQSASASYGGLVNTTTQTFAGAKTFNDSITLAAAKTISMTGGATASRPGSPTEGMLYYDTNLNQLVTYSNGKWQADRSTATKTVGTSAVGGASGAVASLNFAGADYVNTSDTSAQTVINTALSALSTTGGTVYLMEGTYIVDGSISIPDNVTLAGSGAGTIIKLKNGINAGVNAIVNTNTSSGAGVTIRDLKLNGNKANNSSGSQIGIYLSGMGGGTGASAAQGAIVDNIFVTGFRTYGLRFGSVSNTKVVNSTFQNMTDTGLYINGSSYNTISNNIFQGNGSMGLYSSISDNMTITGNTAQSNPYGIAIQSSNYVTVSGNTVYTSTTAGIGIVTTSNSTVASNNVKDSAKGISVDTSNTNTISGNKIHDSGSTTDNNGIYLTAADSNSITSNDITDSSCGTGTSNCYAINVFNSTSDTNYIADNRFSDTDGDATATINNAGTGTIFSNQPLSVDGGQITNRTANDATAFSFQNASGVSVMTIDTSASEVEVGGAIIATGAINGLTVSSGTISVGTWEGTQITDSYVSDTLTSSKFVGSGSTTDNVDLATTEVNGTLAATNGGTGHATTSVGDLLVGAAGNTWNKLILGGNGTCLKSNGTTAGWDTCGGGGDLATSYAADADGGDAIIALTTTDGGIRLQDAATPLATAFSVENNGGTAAYFSVSSAGVAMEDTNSRPTLLMDNSTHQLRVYEDVASSPRYAVMYYDTANNMAVFGASSGATQIGTPGAGGDINLSLSGAATDKLNANKSFTLTGAHSGSDFNFTRNLTGTSYAMTGNLMKIEDTSSFTGGSSSPNLLYINQNNTSATGNLILAQTGGSTDKFKVDVGGNVTAAGSLTGTSLTATTGGVTIASGASYTGAGAVTVSSASNTNLTLLAGGTGKVIVKPGTDSSSSFEVQDSAGTAMILVDSSADQIIVGVSDDVGTVLVFDIKTGVTDPTGTNGAMYYNSGRGKFRCYENSAWRDCIQNNIAKITTDVVNNNATANTLQDVTGLSFAVKSGVTYRFEALIPYSSASTNTGSRWTLNGPAATLLSYKSKYTITATTETTNYATAYSIPSASNASSLATTANVATIEGMITPSADGTVRVQFASEVSNSAITAKAGGTLMWWEIY